MTQTNEDEESLPGKDESDADDEIVQREQTNKMKKHRSENRPMTIAMDEVIIREYENSRSLVPFSDIAICVNFSLRSGA